MADQHGLITDATQKVVEVFLAGKRVDQVDESVDRRLHQFHRHREIMDLLDIRSGIDRGFEFQMRYRDRRLGEFVQGAGDALGNEPYQWDEQQRDDGGCDERLRA